MIRRLGLGLALILAASAQAQTAAPPAPTPAAVPAPRPVVPAAPAAAGPVNALPPDATASAKKSPATSATPAAPVVPLARTRSNIAVLQALDKVTADTIRFEVPVGQPVRYKTLVFTVRACETTAPDEPVPDFSAYVLVDSQPIPAPGKGIPPARQVFRGWMYASSPGLNPLQHPVYDAWLIACKTDAPVTPTAPVKPKAPKPAPVVAAPEAPPAAAVTAPAPAAAAPAPVVPPPIR